MSKKLLFNNLQNNNNNSLEPVVKDGLILHFDGRVKPTDGETIKDLSKHGNNAIISANAKAQRGIQFVNNSIYFSKDGNLGITFPNPLQGLTNFTLEVTFKFTGSYEAGVLGTGDVGITIDDRYIDLRPSGVNKSINANFREKTTITITNSNALGIYNNGEYLSNNSGRGEQTSNVFMLGCSDPTTNEYGKYGKAGLYICSLKIYNRKLSSQDIRKSYEQEKSIVRF